MKPAFLHAPTSRVSRLAARMVALAPLALATHPGLAQAHLDESAAPPPATQQEASAADANARRSFTPADFARFAPRNALDMARQIPGFAIRDEGGDRGLGQADTNVLINGQRISGKANGALAALERIPAEEVVRLEIVDGAGLDIGGLTGQVLNVITRSTGGVTGQFRYSAEWRSFGVPFRWGDGQVSLAGGSGQNEWTLSFENDAGRRGNEGIELVFDDTGTLIDRRDEKSNFDADQPSFSGSFSRTADNGNVLNLNGQVGATISRRSEISLRSGIVDPADRLREFRAREDEFNIEVGADYSFALGPGRLKLIGYHRYEDSPTVSFVETRFDDARLPEASRFERDADEAETIARGEYSVAGLGGDLQFAAEGVKNYLEIDSALFATNAGGILVPVAFEGASARVDEDRAEATVTYSRALTDSLQMQVSAGGEYSKISQTGDQGQTRSFVRPQGFVALDWRASDATSISGRIERVVGQLNFFDFIASRNLDQDRVNVTNADLVPPQSWRFELEASQSLGALGSANLRGFYEDISDIVDQIPIEGGGEAPGNAGSAQVQGIEGEITLLLDPVGLKGLRIDAAIEYAQSEVVDPLLGTPREISDFDYLEFDFDIRQDFLGTPWAIGAVYRNNQRRPNVRLDEIANRTETRGFARVFVEHKDVFGMTARLRVGNLFSQRDKFVRTIFADRAAGLVEQVERRDRRFGTVYSFDLEGSF
ncbi:TonB-dependent receptor plug domain-containing protein [Qipengyuania nanhaisediminis]|uniref:TonB-dependent receptor plug domain-containing protein n=1 Tax=Qipengyuania nanhaisediminis TaxID=604088 RepID=UPI0038B3BE5E